MDDVNSDIVSLKDEIIRLRNEGLLKDALAKTENANEVLDAEFEVLENITAEDIYKFALEENMKLFQSLTKIGELLKNNTSVSQMIGNITNKVNELKNNVKFDNSAFTALKEEIVKLKNEVLLKDAIALSENAREVLNAEFEVVE